MVFKRNKPGPARSKPGGGILARDSLVCIHCHIRVKFGGSLPYTEYEKHLSKCFITRQLTYYLVVFISQYIYIYFFKLIPLFFQETFTIFNLK